MARTLRKLLVRSLIVLVFFWTPIWSANVASRLSLVESLYTRGTAETSESPFFRPVDMVSVDGKFYSDKPPLLAVYSTVFLLPFRPLLSFQDGRWRILYWIVVFTSSGFGLIGIGWLAQRLRRRLKTDDTLPWLLLGIVGATPLVAFARTYNDHVVEAALLLGIFALLLATRGSRSALPPLGIGALLGVVWWLHPLTGTVAGVITALTLAIPPRDEGGTGRPARYATTVGGFLVGAVVALAAGGAVNHALYGRFAPFYFSPQAYFWVDGPGGTESAWLDEPTTPGLSDAALRNRLAQIGLDEERIERTMEARRRIEGETRNPLTFGLRRLFEYDQLTFTPLVVVCLVLVVRRALRRDWPLRREWLWVLTCVAGLYAATLWLRAVPGGSFGDRHLLPVLPPLVVAGFASARDSTDRALLRLAALVSLAIMAPAMIGPWTTPGPAFLAANAVVGVTVLAVAVAAWRSPESGVTARRARALVDTGGGRLTVATAGLAVAEIVLFLASLPVELRTPF